MAEAKSRVGGPAVIAELEGSDAFEHLPGAAVDTADHLPLRPAIRCAGRYRPGEDNTLADDLGIDDPDVARSQRADSASATAGCQKSAKTTAAQRSRCSISTPWRRASERWLPARHRLGSRLPLQARRPDPGVASNEQHRPRQRQRQPPPTPSSSTRAPNYVISDLRSLTGVQRALSESAPRSSERRGITIASVTMNSRSRSARGRMAARSPWTQALNTDVHG